MNTRKAKKSGSMDQDYTPLMSIAKLELRAGQILVIKLHSLYSEVAIERLAQETRKMIPGGIKVMVLDPDVDLMVLEPEKMEHVTFEHVHKMTWRRWLTTRLILLAAKMLGCQVEFTANFPRERGRES